MNNWTFPMYFVGVSGVVDKNMTWQLDCLQTHRAFPGKEYLPYFSDARNASEFAKAKKIDRLATVEDVREALQFFLFLQREKVSEIGLMKRPDRFNPEWYPTLRRDVDVVLADIRALIAEEK
jgi:hypothetical protein